MESSAATHVLAALGLLSVLLSLPLAGWILRKPDLNAAALAEQLRCLIEAGDTKQALELSGSAPAAYCAIGLASVLGAWERGLRSRSGLARAYHRATAGPRRVLGHLRFAGAIAFICAGAAIGLHFPLELEPPTWIWVIGGSGLVCSYVAIRKSVMIPQRSEEALAEVLEALAEHPEPR